MWLGHGIAVKPEESLTIRTINISSPPPPPPPPQAQQNQVTKTMVLEVKGEGPQMQIIDIPRSKINLELPEAPLITSSQPNWHSLDVDWQTFGLESLDSLPTLLTPLRIKMPRSASKRDIKKIFIKLRVIIDMNGAITLLDVVENDYPELMPEINKMIRNSRFSAPMKDGEPVRASFVWPIAINL
jgi:hypothetical protein